MSALFLTRQLTLIKQRLKRICSRILMPLILGVVDDILRSLTTK